jgi:putative ABC transport system permease protein
LRIPLLEGRTFTLADTKQSRPVVVIDQELARRYWPGVDPVGRRVKLGAENFDDPSQTAATIVGVVGTVKAAGLATDLGGYVYQPYSQSPRDRMMTVVARTAVPPLRLAHPVAAALHATAPYSPVSAIRTEAAMLAATQATRTLCLRLLVGFALAALVLALLGVYGLLSYQVRRRTGEIGVRMALGARRGRILGEVLGRGARIGLTGVGFGVLAALALAHVMAALLFGVGAVDWRTYAGVALGVLALVLLACFVPARRAAGLDPSAALRRE